MESFKNKLLALRRGYYCPSFFKLGVETIFELGNLNELPKEPFATFFHEYLHFLQDITTTYGLINGCIIADRMKDANHLILGNKSKTFNVPLQYNTSLTLLNRDIQKVYLGDTINIYKLNFIEIQVEDSDVNLPDPYNKPLEKAVIYYYSDIDNLIVDKFDFGAICLIETMAHIAQKVILPQINHSDVPYQTALIVAKHIYPVIGDNPLFTFSLCDVCLMTYHPSVTFYNMLHSMKSEKFIPKEEVEIYEYVYKNFSNINISLEQLYTDILKTAVDQFSGYFTTDIFENEKIWVEHILKKAYEIRTKNPDFIVQILKKGTANSEEFTDLLNTLGTPLMINLDGLAWFHRPKELVNLEIQIDRFSAIFEIFKLFEVGSKECDLVSYCKNSLDGDVTDSNCKSTPWNRCKQNKLCGYGAFWRTWNLSEYIPK